MSDESDLLPLPWNSLELVNSLKARVAELEAHAVVWDTGKPAKDGRYLVVAEDYEHNRHTVTDYYWAGEWVTYGSFVIAYLKNVPEYKP